MPASSPEQQRLMAQAYALKTGKKKKSELNPKYADEIEKLSKSMTKKQLKDFASTKHKDIKEERVIKNFQSFNTINEDIDPDDKSAVKVKHLIRTFEKFSINEDHNNENFPFLNYIYTSLSDEFKVSVPKNKPNMVAIKVAKAGTEEEMDALSPQIGLSYKDELGIENDVLRMQSQDGSFSSWNGISGNLKEFEILDIYSELENIKRLCDEYNCKLLFTVNDTSVLGEIPSDKIIAAVNARAAGKSKTPARIKDAKTSILSNRYYSFEDLMQVQDEIIYLTIYIYK